MDAAHPLLQPVGVPGDVVVDHQVAELKVDAFSGRLGGDHDLGGLPEVAFLLDPVRQLHLPVDLGDLEVLGQVLHQVIEGVLVLGEDQQLPAAVLFQPEAGDHVEEFGQLALGPAVLDLLGQRQQRPHRLAFSFQLADGVGQPFLQGFFLSLPAGLLVKVVKILNIGEQRGLERFAAAQVGCRVFQRFVDPVEPPLQGPADRPGAGGDPALHGGQREPGGGLGLLTADLPELRRRRTR